MLHFVIGKPRSGKSYYTSANKKGGAALVRELENPEGRYIVTNLPLVMHELEAFMARRGKRIDMAKRITCLEHSQCRQFWRYRGNGYVRDVPDNDPAEKTELHLLQNEEIFSITGDPMHKRGVLYILDEVHVYYPARGCMQKTGNWVFQYATQHGHFTDTILMVTQSLSYVDKQFREMTQDYTYMENERLRSVRGFRKGGGLVARTFIFPPTLGTEEPDGIEDMPLDTEGYGRIYDTSGGAGISGGGSADKGAKVKGLPLKSIWLFVILGFVLFTAGLFGLRSLLHRWLGRGSSKPDTVQTVAAVGFRPEAKAPDKSSASHLAALAPELPRSGQDDPPAVSQAVTWTRLFQRGPRVFVYLSDGRVIASPSRVQYDAAGVVDVVDLDGKHWRISRAPMSWAAAVKPLEEAKK